MNTLLLEIALILLLVLINGLFAMSEMAVMSARKARLQQAIDEGNARAKIALALAEHPTGFLATVQIGITLAGILAGTFGGATLAQWIAAALMAVPLLAPYSTTIGIAIVVVVITYLSLVLGELVPKRLALTAPERIAARVAGPMTILAKIVQPLVRFLSVSTDLTFRLLGIQPAADPAITLEELRILVDQGRQSGVFEDAEQDMIEGVLRLDERRVGSLMTPRTQIIWLDSADSDDMVREKITASGHSRFPVCQGSLENVLGILRIRDLLARSMTCQALDLQSLLLPPLFVPETTSALRVLALLKAQKRHIALVTDEFGSIQGLITHNDILEAVVGEMPGIGEPDEPGAVQRADGSWLVDGLLSVETFKELLGLDELPDETQDVYQTIGGFVMYQIGMIPTVGQVFIWQDIRFEIVDMDGRRVDKVLVMSPPAPDAETAAM